MHTYLDDPIEVTVDFASKHVRPRTVHWDGRRYAMQKVNLIHGAREGTKRIYYFSVSDQTNFMKLRLDTETLQWRLVEFYTD